MSTDALQAGGLIVTDTIYAGKIQTDDRVLEGLREIVADDPFDSSLDLDSGYTVLAVNNGPARRWFRRVDVLVRHIESRRTFIYAVDEGLTEMQESELVSEPTECTVGNYGVKVTNLSIVHTGKGDIIFESKEFLA